MVTSCATTGTPKSKYPIQFVPDRPIIDTTDGISADEFLEITIYQIELEGVIKNYETIIRKHNGD